MELHQNTTLKIGFQNAAYGYKKLSILNDWQLGMFELINILLISAIICMFGIAANITNIVVFLKQGFSNTVNISLFGLAISDLCCILSLLWTGVWSNPFMSNSNIPIVFIEFAYLTGACVHGFCLRITSYITVYVTTERCLCILFPLKIKQLVTPTTTATIVCSIFILNFMTMVPDYATSYFDWKLYPETNKTLLSIAFRSGREQAVTAVFYLFFFTGILSFVALVVFTVTLAFKLQQSSKWRKEATSTSGTTSSKEQKTIKMVVVIATVLIVSYFPGAGLSVTTLVEPEFYLGGQYFRLYVALWSVAFIFHSVNSSINIVLYYYMSSNYRKTFNMIFCAEDKYNQFTRKAHR